jgi:hypothetical protein
MLVPAPLLFLIINVNILTYPYLGIKKIGIVDRDSDTPVAGGIDWHRSRAMNGIGAFKVERVIHFPIPWPVSDFMPAWC